jgi:HlyD family secretion protein
VCSSDLSSVFSGGPGEYEVWVIDGDRATKRKIMVGEMSYLYVTVTGGLGPGERVILSDMESLKNKMEIKLETK